MKKTTLHGVTSKSTKDIFRTLKIKGFDSSLEKGANGTFKILTLINGVDFILSCVDGSEPSYTKAYARNKRSWASFECIDDLVKVSMIKKDSDPTSKQKALFLSVTEDITKFYSNEIKLKVTIPKTVSEMCLAIREAMDARTLLSNGLKDTVNISKYVHLQYK